MGYNCGRANVFLVKTVKRRLADRQFFVSPPYCLDSFSWKNTCAAAALSRRPARSNACQNANCHHASVTSLPLITDHSPRWPRLLGLISPLPLFFSTLLVSALMTLLCGLGLTYQLDVPLKYTALIACIFFEVILIVAVAQLSVYSYRGDRTIKSERYSCCISGK